MKIVDKIMFKVAKSQINKNLIEDYSKGKIKVVLLGTGGPINNEKRLGSTSFAIITPKDFILIDCGSGTWRNADILGLPSRKLTKIFITHFHSDHIGDLGEACFGSWVRGRTSPLEIYGPSGIKDVVDGFQRAYSKDFEYRTAHHGEEFMNPKGSQMKPRTFKFGEEGKLNLMPVYEDDHVTVGAFSVNHDPIKPAVGYRIEVDEKVIVYTGDTVYIDSLPKFCENADLLLANAVSHQTLELLSRVNKEIKNDRIAKIMHDVPDYQMDPAQAGVLAHRSRAKKLVLVHITPPIINFIQKRWFLKGAKAAYHGEIVLGEDGMVLTL